MNDSHNIQLLQENLEAMGSAIKWLQRSIGICAEIGINGNYTEEQYDAFEVLTSRYCRAIDLIIRKVLRSLDLVEFEQPGSLIDTVNRAEKRGLIASVIDLRVMTELRNKIAHDYVEADLVKTFESTLDYASKVIILESAIRTYVQEKL